MAKTFNLPATQIKDFQIRREVQDIKNALADIPIIIGDVSPNGNIAANPGSIYVLKGDPSQLFYKASGTNRDGWIVILGNFDVFWDEANGRLGIGTTTPQNTLDVMGSDECFTVSALTGAAGIGINKWGTGDRFAYLDFYSSGLPGAIDYSSRIIRDPSVNAAWRFDQTGTGNIEFQRNGATQFFLPNGQAFGFTAITKYLTIYGGDFKENGTGAPNKGDATFPVGTGYIFHSLHLPTGSTLVALDFYCFDNSASNAECKIERKPLATNTPTVLATANTSGTPGNTTVTLSAINEVIDNSQFSYLLIFDPPVSSANLALRNVRVTYTVAGSASMS